MIVRPVLCRPFIGRRQELAYLRERRLEAGLSHGGMVLVAGDAGVGKSRLIAEFCKSLAYARWKVGQGACLEFARPPYGPILEALAQVSAAKLELAAAATKREQFDSIVDRIGSIAARSALILVVEDLHWADAATLDLLAYLGPKLERMRVLVVASVRADELYPAHPSTNATAKIARSARAGRIDLGPLRGSDLRAFIDEALAGIPLPEEERRAVAIAGDGNPFFTEELLKSAVEQSSLHAETQRRRRAANGSQHALRTVASLRCRRTPRGRASGGDRSHVRTKSTGSNAGSRYDGNTAGASSRSRLPTRRRSRAWSFSLPSRLDARRDLQRIPRSGAAAAASHDRARARRGAFGAAIAGEAGLPLVGGKGSGKSDGLQRTGRRCCRRAPRSRRCHRLLRASARVRRRAGRARIDRKENRGSTPCTGLDERSASDIRGGGGYLRQRGRSRIRSKLSRDGGHYGVRRGTAGTDGAARSDAGPLGRHGIPCAEPRALRPGVARGDVRVSDPRAISSRSRRSPRTA